MKKNFVRKGSCEVMKSSFKQPSGNFPLEKLQQIKNLYFLYQKNFQKCTSGHVE